MISNHVLTSKRNRIAEQRDNLVNKKKELTLEIQQYGITKQAAWKHRTGKSDAIDMEVIDERAKVSNQIRKIDFEIAELNTEIRTIQADIESAKNRELINVFKEIFTREQMIEIRIEAERRIDGGHPFKLSFNVQESIKIAEERAKYKKLLIEQLDKMISFRILLTGLIDNGCDQFGNAEFLKFISPLNRLIIPVEEFEKIKRKIIG